MRGETPESSVRAGTCWDFNPLPSCEGRHLHSENHISIHMISIHSPHARGDPGPATTNSFSEISIHSPHARGDAGCPQADRFSAHDFNPLPSCEGRRSFRYSIARSAVFQSTPLMRGETIMLISAASILIFQSTPLMRGETMMNTNGRKRKNGFQSTPLMRGETISAMRAVRSKSISIHCPHARGDSRKVA